MKITLSTYEAAEMLRQDQYAKWTPNGALALVRYLEDLEESSGGEIELVLSDLRGDYNEFPSLFDWAQQHFQDYRDELGLDPDDYIDSVDDAIRDYIQDRGTLLEFEGGIIVSSF